MYAVYDRISIYIFFQYAEHFSIPLLVMVGELERQQSELISILKGKDREIEDYKAQGSKVTRSMLFVTVILLTHSILECTHRLTNLEIF